MGYNNQSDGESTKATAYPTAFPTSHPTEAAYQDKCMNGQTEVDYGWHGAGAGDNWCNLCKCSRMTHSSDPANRAALHCQKKICQTKTDFGQICSHTKCHFVYNFEAQHRVMMVSSHHAEQNGKNHACAFNPRDNACECRCSGALSTEHLNMQFFFHAHQPRRCDRGNHRGSFRNDGAFRCQCRPDLPRQPAPQDGYPSHS